jgi:hypothetical protein
MHCYAMAIREILGIWEAWQEFCATAGVDPETKAEALAGSISGSDQRKLLIRGDIPFAFRLYLV